MLFRIISEACAEVNPAFKKDIAGEAVINLKVKTI